MGYTSSKAMAYPHPFTERLYKQSSNLFHAVILVAPLTKRASPRNWVVFARLASQTHSSHCHQHRALPFNTCAVAHFHLLRRTSFRSRAECSVTEQASRSFVLWVSLTLLTQFLSISNATCYNCPFCCQLFFWRNTCFWSPLFFICFSRTCYEQRKVSRTNCSFVQYSDFHVAVQPIII